MSSAYKNKLIQFYGESLVQIDRNGASDITGAVEKVEESGVTIIEQTEDGETGRTVFIAYVDIRGVSEAGIDPRAVD